jgi:DNA-binding PadR family transcriptional regulator
MKTEQKISTLGYALLGVLARRPRSGYDLAREMQRPIGFYWQARHSQIYPELARIEGLGLVTHEVIVQKDLPAKKVYTITAVGLEALRAWLATGLDMSPVRDELVLRAYSLWLADPAAARELFRDHERMHAEQLRSYEEVERRLLDAAGVKSLPRESPLFAEYATLKIGLAYERAYAEWCRWVVAQLEEGQ